MIERCTGGRCPKKQKCLHFHQTHDESDSYKTYAKPPWFLSHTMFRCKEFLPMMFLVSDEIEI